METTLKELREVLSKKLILIDELEEKAEKVDLELKKSGGLYYHKKGWVENIEMLMVAAIVVIGIRSFFLQPFIIPTNSMYPSFFGMQPHLYEEDNEVPSLLERSVDLHSYLFGDILAVNSSEIYYILFGGFFVLIFLYFNWSSFVLMTIDEKLARAEGINVVINQLLIMLLMTIVVAVSFKIVGLLLITSLLIIPAL